MTTEHDPRHPWNDVTDQLCAWGRELDACDGYLVIVGSPLDDEHHRIFGPYDDRDALETADHLSAACDERVSVVRFHYPTTGGGRSIPRPRTAGQSP